MNSRSRVSTLARVGCILGEGPHWDSQRELLWQADILGCQILWIDVNSRVVQRRSFSEPVGWVIPVAQSDTALVGMKSGIGLIDLLEPEEPLHWINRGFPGNIQLRNNDAKADWQGRLWCGSVHVSEDSPTPAALARFDPSLETFAIIDDDFRVPNGPAFSPDRSFMLQNDSARRVTFLYPLDPHSGDPSSRVVWQRFEDQVGLPDGMTFDAEGFVWIAFWGAGEVRRFDPLGNLDQVVELPVPYVTSVCFGGQSLERLFVTSARGGGKNPQAQSGDVFEIHDPGVTGQAGLSVCVPTGFTNPFSRKTGIPS